MISVHNPSNLWTKASLTVLLIMVLCSAAFTQQQVEPKTPPPPPPGVQQQQKENAAEPDHKITAAEAQELFASFDQILKFASDDTGLPIKSPVQHKIVGRDEVEKYMLDRMKDDPDAKKLDRSEISLKKFGLIPKDMNLRSFLVALLKDQIAGFYDSKTKVMYLLDWVAPEAQKPVLAHELTHALQDQNFDLEKWGQVNEKNLEGHEEMVRDEERAARQAVVEGQATVVLVDYLLKPYGKSVEDSPEVVDLMKKQMVSTGSTPLFAQAPLFLKQALMFPYDAGFDFERAMLSAGGKLQSYSAIFKNPPVDTRQIMEPRTYLDQKHWDIPKLADLPGLLAKDYDKFDDGGFGEFDVQILVKQWKPSTPPDDQEQSEVAAAAAAAAASSRGGNELALIHAWRGGYYMSFHNKGVQKDDKNARVYIAFLMHMATPKDAAAFLDVYRVGLKQRYKTLTAKPAGVIDTEAGPVVLATDGEWFTATEGFDVSTAEKVRQAMIKTAMESDATKAKSATVQ